MSPLACAVCFSTDAGRSNAYLVVTLGLLTLVFGLFGAGALWVWRQERRRSGSGDTKTS